MASDERSDVGPLIEELLELVREHAPTAVDTLVFQRKASRLMFEAYRRGTRNGRQSRGSSLEMKVVDRDE